MKRILVITSDFDRTVEYIIDKYERTVDFFIVNINKFDEYKIYINNNGWTIVNNAKKSITESETYAIYYRKPTLPKLNDFSDMDKMIIQNDIVTILHGIVNAFEGNVLTKPSKLKKVENKVYQLLYANKNNIATPKSL